MYRNNDLLALKGTQIIFFKLWYARNFEILSRIFDPKRPFSEQKLEISDKTFVIFHGENFDDSIIIRENVILVYSRMKSSRTHLSFTSRKWTWAPVFSQTNIFHYIIKISEISRQEKSGQKSQKGSKTIMNDQLMREKVKDLSFLNLEFHFERLICVKIVKMFWNFSSLEIPDHP